MTIPTHADSTPPCLAQQRGVLRFFMAHWQTAALSTAVSIVLEHHGMLGVFTKLSWLILFGNAAPAPKAPMPLIPGNPAIFLIQENDFVHRYSEKTPINRCELAHDIQRIVDKSPQYLAIDFDLSPQVNASSEDEQCQKRLDNLVDREAHRLILLAPFPTSFAALQDAKHQWMLARCHAGVAFADGVINASFGAVTEQAIGETDEHKVQMAAQMVSGPSPLICQQVRNAQQADTNPWLNREAQNSRQPAGKTTPINFPLAIKELPIIAMDSALLNNTVSLKGSTVLLGGSYGKDDLFLTNIGELPGAVVHGASMLTLAKPIKQPPMWLSWLLEMGMALGFAGLVVYFWSAYADLRKLDRTFEITGSRSAVGSLALLTFCFTFLALIFFLILVSHHVLNQWGMVIAPLVIVAPMLIDGFVSGPVDKLNELLDPDENRKPTQQPAALAGHHLKIIAFIGVLTFLFLGCSLFVWTNWGSEKLLFIAGWGFLLLLAIFYLLLLLQALCHGYDRYKTFTARTCSLKRSTRYFKQLISFKSVGSVQWSDAICLRTTGRLLAWLKSLLFVCVMAYALHLQF